MSQPLRKLVLSSAGLSVGLLAVLRYQDSVVQGHSGRKNLHEVEFTKWRLVAKTDVSSSNKILTLRPPQVARVGDDCPGTPISPFPGFNTWSVRLKQPQLQIERAYTPIPIYASPEAQARQSGDLNFLIRRDGEVSRYVSDLPVGANVEVRGPTLELSYPLNPEDVDRRVLPDEVLFLAGGTGIAPALQIANQLRATHVSTDLVADSSDPVRPWNGHMTILWANRKRDDCIGGVDDELLHRGDGNWSSWLQYLSIWQHGGAEASNSQPVRRDEGKTHAIVTELEQLKRSLATTTKDAAFPRTTASAPQAPITSSMLEVKYFVDAEHSSITPSFVRDLLRRPARQATPDNPIVNKEMSGMHSEQQRRKLLIVSGPPGFVAHFAGPKVWQGGKEVQGQLGGMLGRFQKEGLLTQWDVYKL